ncbi:hypothetical protein LTR27_004496 [Elasticomyces elasticus]|nr:hypothetical protein LTR27_004496 [Elasticomyces elasticus]
MHVKDIIVRNTEHDLIPSHVVNVVKRALTFEAARETGCTHLTRLRGGTEGSSIFTSVDSLRDNGWDDPTGDHSVALETDVKGVYSHASLRFSTSNADNPHYDWYQAESGVTAVQYGEVGAGFHYDATYGQYRNQMNPKAGVLLCLNNFSPDYYVKEETVDGPSPPLKKFTDVLWFQWLDAAGDNVGNVKYFYRHHVVDENSVQVLDYILNDLSQELKTFPGTIYPMDAADGIGKALLGTPNGNGVAWFLYDRAAQIGRKTVTKAQLFGSGANRNILFHIAPI